MKTCFVAMPSGKKTDPATGITTDFDLVYRELIEPAISGTEYKYYRVDNTTDFSNLQKLIFQSIMTSDIMIADLTTLNPNVMYELGIRHMAQRGLTIMICAAGTIVPFDIASFRVISYGLNTDGTVNETSKSSFLQLLNYSLNAGLEQTVVDSPIYQFFDGISVTYPPNIGFPESKGLAGKKYKSNFYAENSSSVEQRTMVNLKEIQETALKDPNEVAPNEFIILMKKYRDMSAWKDLINLAEQVPENVRRVPEVQQLYALALNRVGNRDKAIAVINNLIEQTGGDAESYGILGRIYKDKYEQAKASDDSVASEMYLNEAIKNYKLGFEKQPDDYYTGVNVVNLLIRKTDEASKKELENVLQRVRASLKSKIDDAVPDYWVYATAVELSCIAREWDDAESQIKIALQFKTEAWMLATLTHNLEQIKPTYNEADRTRLTQIISTIQSATTPGEGLSNA